MHAIVQSRAQYMLIESRRCRLLVRSGVCVCVAQGDGVRAKTCPGHGMSPRAGQAPDRLSVGSHRGRNDRLHALAHFAHNMRRGDAGAGTRWELDLFGAVRTTE